MHDLNSFPAKLSPGVLVPQSLQLADCTFEGTAHASAVLGTPDCEPAFHSSTCKMATPMPIRSTTDLRPIRVGFEASPIVGEPRIPYPLTSGLNSAVGMSGAFPLDGLNNSVRCQYASSTSVNLVPPTRRQVRNEARTGILLSTSAKQDMQSS